VWKQPYHRTLLAFAGICDVERVDRLLARGDDLRRAFLFNQAFASPGDLTKAQAEYDRELRTPRDRRILTKEDVLAMGQSFEEYVRTLQWRKRSP
jgi:hypothetical protein